MLLLPLSDTAHLERALEETVAAAHRLHDSPMVLGVRLGVRDGEVADDELEQLTNVPAGIEILDCAVCYDPQTFKDAAARGLPVFEHDPSSRVARCFLELGREMVVRVLEARV